MQQVSPNQKIPLVYVISDPSDSTTYYPQAVIKDTATGSVIQTINLSLDVTGRYIGTAQPIADTSGLGRFVDITTTVYTDSGHSIKSNKYAVVCDPYLIIQQWSPTMGTGGGTSYVDYDRIKEIYGEDRERVLKDIEGRIKVPKPEKVKYGKIKEMLDELPKLTPEEIQEKHSELVSSMNKLQSVIEDVKNDPRVQQSAESVRLALTTAIEDSRKIIASETRAIMLSMFANFRFQLENLIDERLSEKEITMKIGSVATGAPSPYLESAKNLL